MEKRKKLPLLIDIRFILYCLIGMLVLIRDVNGVGINRFIIIGIAMLICLISDCDELVFLAAFIAPLHTGISGTFIVLLIFGVYLITRKSLSISYIEVLSIIIILLLELASAFRGGFNITEYMRFAIYFVFVFLVILDRGKNCDGEKVAVYFISGYMVALGCVWGQMLGKYSFDQILKLGIRFGDVNKVGTVLQEGMKVSFNQNDLGFICAIVAVLSLIMRNRSKKPVYYLVLGISVLTCIMTMSRGALLALSIGLVLYYLVNSNNIRNSVRNIVTVSFGIGLLLYLVNKFIPSYLIGLMERFTGESLLNGRDTIMAFYNGELFSHIDRLLLGVGLQHYPDKFGYTMSAHNATQEIVITWGIIGLLIVVFILIRGLKVAKITHGNIKPEKYIPFIILMIGLQSGQGFSQYSHMLYLLVVYSVLYMEEVDERKIKNSKYN